MYKRGIALGMALLWWLIPSMAAACSHMQLPSEFLEKVQSHAAAKKHSHDKHSHSTQHEPSHDTSEGHCEPGKDHCDPDMLGSLEGTLLKKASLSQLHTDSINLLPTQSLASTPYQLIASTGIIAKTGPPPPIFLSSLFHHHILLLI